MADQINGSTALVSGIKEFAARPKDGNSLQIQYRPVASSGTLGRHVFVTISSGEIAAATAGSTSLYGITNGTNQTSWAGAHIAKPPQEKNAAGTDLVPVMVADENLQFVIEANANTTEAMVGTTCDIEITSGRTYADVTTPATNVLRIIALVDPAGNNGRRVLCVVDDAARATE